MVLPNKFRRLIRQETDAECIERARKQVRFIEKWGKWAAISYFLLGTAMALPVIGFGWAINRMNDLWGNAGNPGIPQPRDLIWLGFVCGLLFGFIAGHFLLKGADLVVQGMNFLRGDRTYALLLEYHDGIVTLMRSEQEELNGTAIGQQPQGRPSNDQPSG